MASLNRIQIIGQLGRDPELKYTPSGKAVATFSVATTEKWKNSAGGEESDTQWHNIECWDKTAEFVGKHCFKGQSVFVEGRQCHESYEKDGVTKYYSKVRCRDIQPLQWRDKGDKPQQQQEASSDVTLDDDIPI